MIAMTGLSDVKSGRCNFCGEMTDELVKIHSTEDKSTLRICHKHWREMREHAREWDLWMAVAFPKHAKRVYHKDPSAWNAEVAEWEKQRQAKIKQNKKEGR